MPYEGLCRTCLQRGYNFVPIVSSNYISPDGNSVVVLEMINLCASIEIFNDDDFPKQICQECYSKLLAAYNFRLLCENSHRWFVKNRLKFKEIQIKHPTDAITAIKEEYVNNEDIKLENEQSIKIENDFIKDEVLTENVSYNSDNGQYPLDPKSDCDYSVNETVTKINLKKHVQHKVIKKNKLGNTPTSKKKLKNIKCHLCPKLFRYNYLLREHVKSHYNSKDYYCPTCKKYYTSQKLHEKYHSLEKKFICDLCSKRFTTKSKMCSHIQTHANNREKPFKCKIPECGKAYFALVNLKRHELCHSGTKNFMCHSCSKTFIDKGGLICHLRQHFQEKEYACRYCDEKFRTPSNRYSHELRHKERKYACQHCGSMFFNTTHLKRHMLTHTLKKHFKCSFCSTRYSRSDNKRRHEMTVHGYINNEKLCAK